MNLSFYYAYPLFMPKTNYKQIIEGMDFKTSRTGIKSKAIYFYCKPVMI
jgi:hypothetical protein